MHGAVAEHRLLDTIGMEAFADRARRAPGRY
jgi:hypothetical protein